MKAIAHSAAAVIFLFAPTMFAQTYIISERDCGAVTLHVKSGTDFLGVSQPVTADRIANVSVNLPGKKFEVKPSEMTQAQTFEANVPEEVVVMAAVKFKPEVDAGETRTDHAKALVFCGPTAPRADWQRSTGLGLEIYPQGWNGPRPEMKPGDSMRFIAVEKSTNQLLRDLPMELYRAGAGKIADGVPHTQGGMKFSYPEPGLYMVVATHRRADPQNPNHCLVDTSTLTFAIK